MNCGPISNAIMNVLFASSFEPLPWALYIGGAALVVALVLGCWRLVKGPTRADRIMALDLLTGTVMALTVFLSILFDFSVYLDVAVAFALIAFLSTAILARVMEERTDDD